LILSSVGWSAFPLFFPYQSLEILYPETVEMRMPELLLSDQTQPLLYSSSGLALARRLWKRS
jgi:hypothetical protein